MESRKPFLKVFGTFAYRKKCHYILVIYIICYILYYFIFYQQNCDAECCRVRSIEALNLQKSFRNKVETHFENSYSRSKMFSAKSNSISNSSWAEIPNIISVYSAYLDSCPTTFLSSYCIKFVGAISSNFSELNAGVSPFKCAFRYNSSVVVKRDFAFVRKVPEDHGKIFTAALFFCSLFGVNNESQWPEYASLSQYDKHVVWLPIHIRVPLVKSPQDTSISLCVRPLYGSVSAVALGEFLAYYSAVGVDHFILYNYKLLGTAVSFLTSIHLANISVELLPWDIPLNEDEIHEYGQIIFSQDCLARSRHIFSHTLIVDIDEFLVPKIHRNLKVLVNDLDSTHPQAGSYILLMSLFCDEFPMKTVKVLPLKILMQNARQKSVWEPGFRSKYIIKPERVQVVGIHNVWAHESGMKEVVVPSSTALLNQYKPCCNGVQTWFFNLLSFRILRDKVIEDASLLQFENLITSHLVIQFLLHPDRFFTQNKAKDIVIAT